MSGNFNIWERSHAALRRAEHLVEANLYADSAGLFITSLALGSASGGPRIATAVFDELTSSGGLMVIEDLDVRRGVLELYARVEIQAVRSANSSDRIAPGLKALVARHLPSGLVQRDGPRSSLDEGRFSPQEIRAVAESIGSEPSLASEIRAEIGDRDSQGVYLQNRKRRLEDGREELAAAVGSVGEP